MKKYLLLVVFAVVIFIPYVVSADLIPCGGEGQDPCQFCHLVSMANDILVWLIGILFVVFAVVIVMAGFGLVTSGGNPEAKTAAKKRLANAFIGIIIVLSAWLIVDTIMMALLSDGGMISGYGVWSKVECWPQPTPSDEDLPSLPPTVPPEDVDCTDIDSLIDQFSGSPVGQVYAPLNSMINCYKSQPSLAGKIDLGQIYTVDLSHPICAATNGNPVCSACSHSANSCHYGRGTGNGAMGVDFNAAAGTSEAQLYSLIQAAQSTCGGKLNFESNHTHISYDGKFGGESCP